VQLNREAVRGWARYREGAAILKALTEELAGPALDVISAELGDAGGRSSAEELVVSVKKGQSPAYVWNDRVHLRFAIPARAAPEERLRIQFFAHDGQLHFCVEARYPDARELIGGLRRNERLSELTDELATLSPPFIHGHDWESYWTRWHSLDSVIDDGANPVEKLLAWVREDVRDLARAGLFETLQEISERQERTSRPAHDE
jgi:hypothetical protein